MRALLPTHPEGPAPSAPLRPTVRGLQERWPVAALSGEPAPVTVGGARRTATTGAARIGVALAVVAGVLLADQLTKWWAVRRLAAGPVHVVWRLDFELSLNTGS